MDWSHIVAQERPKDDRDILLGAVQAPVSIPSTFLPDNSWLTTNFQGQTPTCGAHASSHFKAILDRIQSPATAPRYNPRFSWVRIKAIDGFPLTAGTDMRSIFKSQQNDGMDDYEPLENDVTLPLATYSEPTAITADMAANAVTKKIRSYAFGATDLESLCHAIFQNGAVLLLIKCDDGFWGTVNPTFTTAKYGHFVVADGYSSAGLRVIDSADPNPAMRVKTIAKQYITSQFIIDSGTALDMPVAQLQQIVQQANVVAEQIPAAPIPAAQKETLLEEIETLVQDVEDIL